MPIEVFKNALGQLTAHSAEKCLTITEDVMIIMGFDGSRSHPWKQELCFNRTSL